MEELLRHVMSLVLKVCGCLLPLAVMGWLAVMWTRRGMLQLRRLQAWLDANSAIGRLLLGGWLAACVLWGSEKNPSNSPPMMASGRATAPARYVPEGEFALAVPFTPPPDGAITNLRWLARGGFEDALRLPFPGDGFTWRDGVATGLTVFANGEIRPESRDPYFPVPFSEGLSLPPRSRAAGESEGVFWHGVSATNSLLLTWEGAFRGRDSESPVDFQAEFYPDGSFEYRYENYRCRYPPSYAFDYDNDGLENSVDPQPTVPGADAHGTNAEWYNALYGNLFTAVDSDGELELSWNDGVNSNAYYFVDVVASNGPAPVCFFDVKGRRPDDPVVVARPGEVCRVPLVIGPTYMVTSSVPFTVSPSSSSLGRYASPDVIDIALVDGGCTVAWPVKFEFREDADDDRAYTIGFTPSGLDISYSWTMRSLAAPVLMRPLMAMALGASGGGCECFQFAGSNVTVSCSGSCECGGCVLGGFARHVGHELDIPCIYCGCSDEGEEQGQDEEQTWTEPHVTAYFTGAAVIYEDAYVTPIGENAQGAVITESVDGRSSQVGLVIRVDGGTNGGRYSIKVENQGKLAPVACGPFGASYSGTLGPGQSTYEYYTFEGAEPSDGVGDVRITGKIIDSVTGDIYNCPESRLTVFKIRLSAYVDPQDFVSRTRHCYGVNEKVMYEQWPAVPLLNSELELKDGNLFYHCPLNPCNNPLIVSYQGITYVPLLSVIAPTYVMAKNPEVRKYSNVTDGNAGGVGLIQELHVLPDYVTFSQIAVEEVPCYSSTFSGYFNLSAIKARLRYWSHVREAGAGNWYNVNAVGRIGGDELILDTAALINELPRVLPNGAVTTNTAYGWRKGVMEWDIPFGWNHRDPFVTADPVGVFATDVKHIFSMSSTGSLSISKLGNTVRRDLNGNCYLNDVLKPNPEEEYYQGD